MTNGSSLETVGWSSSVGGFHGVQAYFGFFTVMRWTTLEKVPEVAALWGQLCFTAMSPWRPVRIGWLAPYSYLGPMDVQIRGQGPLLGFVLSSHVRMVSDTLLVRNP
jgi:hypothetical protein